MAVNVIYIDCHIRLIIISYDLEYKWRFNIDNRNNGIKRICHHINNNDRILLKFSTESLIWFHIASGHHIWSDACLEQQAAGYPAGPLLLSLCALMTNSLGPG